MSEPSARQPVDLSGADRHVLWFLAEHRMVLERQIAVLLDAPLGPVGERLQDLEDAGYLRRFAGWGNAYGCRIRKAGLTAVGSELRPPNHNPGAYRHDVGAAWLWLLARQGRFGPLAEVIGERRLRSEDMAAPDRPYSVRLGGYDGKGRLDVHFPDLLLIDRRGRRVALELELSSKKVARREAILAGYGADRRLEGVVYFVERNPAGRRIARAIESSTAELGVVDRVHLRTLPPIQLDGGLPREDRNPRQRRTRLLDRGMTAEADR